MSADKRTVHTDALATLGTIIDSTAGRDAIHIAVEPCQAGERLRPGDNVAIHEGVAKHSLNPVGIVDPFLKDFVKTGEWFWMLVYPRTITSLRHVWSHPAFAELEGMEDSAVSGQDKVASEAWLRAFCEASDCPGYDDVVAAAIGKNLMENHEEEGYPGYYRTENDGVYLHFGGRDAHGLSPPEFWDHIEVVTGVKIPQRKRASYFSCSC